MLNVGFDTVVLAAACFFVEDLLRLNRFSLAGLLGDLLEVAVFFCVGFDTGCLGLETVLVLVGFGLAVAGRSRFLLALL